MPHADILKIVLKFENVPPGQSATQDHQIKIKGVGQLPDHIHYDNGAFSGPVGIVANDTSVTVTNNSAAEASVNVLVEHWHSIPRVFGDVNQDSLAVRPYISGPGALDGGPGVDELVKASDADTTAGKLNTKLSAGANIALAIANPGANESVVISALVPVIPGTAAPITVTGPTNADAASGKHADAEHQHRLEMAAQDEGIAAGARPTFNFLGVGVGAVDDPANDRVNITVPGTPSDGATVARSTYIPNLASTSGIVFVDGMSGLNVAVPIDGSYWAVWEGEFMNSNASAVLEIGIGVNSTTVVVANSAREIQGNASDMGSFITSIELGPLVAGDLVRGLFRKASGPLDVSIIRRNLTIFKVQ